jgi:succinate dehydrogenase/fumarate reductase flavoprotein subunit
MSTEEIQDREPTPEEIAEMRERMQAYYDNQIPFLTKQKEYETLLADIEQARARRIEMTIRIAQMTMGPQNEEPDDMDLEKEVEESPKKRTLKK